jgi:murein DD-endopeptidase MepM/ murein hydrolase activator NlpD
MHSESRAALTFICAALLITGAERAAAQQPVVTASPARPAPGSLVRLILDAGASQADSIVAVTGRMSGEPLHFVRRESGAWGAIGPVSVDAVDSVAARVTIARASGSTDSVTTFVKLPPRPRPTAASGRRRLNVDSRFTRPLDQATQDRIDRENARAREVGRNAHATEAMWTTPFINPRAASITSRFGSGRMFNGTLSSRHLGVDFQGAVGSVVNAANRGVVALVDEFFLAGNVVYIDHGAGVVTGYFHLSAALVAPGDTVAKGQRIGLVGATGRVTGPHLHWNARYGAVTVNPLDLVRIGTP